MRQKTMLKWLLIVFFVIVIISCYIMFGTNFSLNPAQVGNNSADADASQKADESVNSKPDQNTDISALPEQKVYSTYPRQPERIDNFTLAHTGGESNDICQDMLIVGENQYLIFESDSTQYDTQESGIYISTFLNSTLTKTRRISDLNEHLIAVKLTSLGILVVLSGTSVNSDQSLTPNSTFILLNLDGETQKQFESSPVADCLVMSNNGGIQIFATDKNTVQAHSIDNNFDLVQTTSINKKTDRLLSIPSSNGHMIAFMTDDDILHFYSFSNNQFCLVNSHQNIDIKQIVPAFFEHQLAYIALISDSNKGKIAVLDQDFNITLSKDCPSADTAIISTNNNQIVLLDQNGKTTYCRHLDLVTSVPNLTQIASLVKIESGQNYFGSYNGSELAIYDIDNTKTPIFKISDIANNFEIKEYAGNIFVAFTSNSTNGFCYNNFGESDTFMLKFKKPIS